MSTPLAQSVAMLLPTASSGQQSRRSLRLLLMATFLGPCVGMLAATPAKPNILFILSDDQSWEALGATGGEVKTPNLDRLAARGMLFTSGYNMGSWTGAVCVASRTMFNTGRSLWHCRDLEQALLAYKATEKEGKLVGPKPDMGTIWSQWLKAAGYRTYFAGKWHTAIHEAKSSFDVVGTIRPGMARDTPDGYNRPDADGVRTWLPWDKSKGGHWEGGKHWAAILADEGVGLIDQAAHRDEPFFMYLAFNSPHDPRQSPKEYVDMYPIDSIKVPRNFLPDYPYRNEIGLPDSQRDERLAPHPRTEFAIKVHRQEYYALVTYLDYQIGRLLDALDKSGKANNTFIFFTSDHGLSVGHHGLLGKQSMYEHSLRAPVIAVGPGIAPGRRTDARIYIQDIVPTTLAVADVSIPAGMEFSSLLPLLHGDTQKGRDQIYAAYFGFQRAVIVGDWKLVHYPVPKVFRLFNLAADPDEMDDLAADPAQALRLTELKKALTAQMQAHDDPLLRGESLMPKSEREL